MHDSDNLMAFKAKDREVAESTPPESQKPCPDYQALEVFRQSVERARNTCRLCELVVITSFLCSATLFHVNTVLDPLSREWSPQSGLEIRSLIRMIRTISKDMTTTQPDLACAA